MKGDSRRPRMHPRPLSEVVADAEEVLVAPEAHRYNPSLLLELLVGIAKKLDRPPEQPLSLDPHDMAPYGTRIDPQGNVRVWIGVYQTPPLTDAHIGEFIENLTKFREQRREMS